MLKKTAIVLVFLAAFVTAALFLAPWNRIVEGRLVAALESKGYAGTSLTVEKISFHEIILSNVTLGGEMPVSFGNITLAYTPRELFDGSIQRVALNGVNITARQNETGSWQISGLPQSSGDDRNARPLSLTAIANDLPFSHISLANSTLAIDGHNISGILPFTLSFDKSAKSLARLSVEASSLRVGAADIAFGPLSAEMEPASGENWTGRWQLAALDFSDLTPAPVMAGGGVLNFNAGKLTMDGNLDSKDKSHRAAFNLLIDPQENEASKLTVNTISFPFKEGRVAGKNIVVPFSGTAPVTVALNIQQVSVDAMMQALTGKRVTATGTFSGSVPLIISRDGSYTVGRGALKADGAGTIQMSPDAIPGDNAQVALVRDILQNLNYSALGIQVESAKGRNMTLTLSLEGRNPDVLDGRPVKLNINLTGDVLDFIQQNIMLFTNPESLLKQGAYE